MNEHGFDRQESDREGVTVYCVCGWHSDHVPHGSPDSGGAAGAGAQLEEHIVESI